MAIQSKIQSSRFIAFHIFLLHMFCFLNVYGADADQNINSEQKQLLVPIGVVLDLNSSFGTMINLCMDMAVSDYYSSHSNHITRLQLHKKDAKSVLDVNFAALDLLERQQVHGILWPQGSTQESFVAELGNKVHVPIISFTARSSTLSNTENNFFVRKSLNDSNQARALAAICQEFKWTKVVLLYEDTEYGHQFLSDLGNAFQYVEIGLVHLTAIPSSASNSHLSTQLSMLMKKETKVFLVHMNPSLGFRLFTLAKKVGMMTQGYAWMISDSLSNFLNSMDSVTRDSMEGVVGVRPYVPISGDLENFQKRWKRNSMIQKKNAGGIMDLNVYGLWAYDTVTSLAIAAEKVGPVNSSSLHVKRAISGTRNTKLRISSFGPRLLRELSATKFKGLSGDFGLLAGKLKPSSTFEMINIIGTGERRVGFWTPDRGILRELNSSGEATNSTSTKELENVFWPGDSRIQPKGWAIPPTGSLRVGVPCKSGYTEFVKLEIDPATNRTISATGFAIDIFLAALKLLPFSINYEFICYNDTENPHWTYDDMLHGIPQKKYDMVVGDTTIWAPRASHVDFSLPYSESGVVMVVKNNKALDMWIFIKPFRWDLWLLIAAACIFMAIVIWRLESRAPNADHGEEQVRRHNDRLQITYLAPVVALAFQDRSLVSNSCSVFVLVCWLFMAAILMQSFTANFSAMLTLDQLKFAFSEDYYVGYHEASFMKQFLVENLHIKESRMRPYSSVEGFHDAMSRGSKHGGVDVIFDEIPYMKLLLNRYESQYKVAGPTYKTDGLGFAFPMGSPLAAYFNRAILNVTQSSGMMGIELRNFGPGYSSQDSVFSTSTVSQGMSSLTSRQFLSLFVIVGILTVIALACSEAHVLIRRRLSNANRHTHGMNPEENGVDAVAPVADGAGAGGDERNQEKGGEERPPQQRNEETELARINNGANNGQDGGEEISDHHAINL